MSENEEIQNDFMKMIAEITAGERICTGAERNQAIANSDGNRRIPQAQKTN